MEVKIECPDNLKHDAALWKYAGDCVYKVLTESESLPRAFARGRWRVRAEESGAGKRKGLVLSVSVTR